MFGFILAGLLFSGYLSSVKLFSDVCAFGASCPYFLGYPACYTGFIVYLVLTIATVVALVQKRLSNFFLVLITGASLFGVLFSGKLTLNEMAVLFSDGFVAFVKTLPLCSIGFIFFIVIFILSLVIGKREDKEIQGEENISDDNNEISKTE